MFPVGCISVHILAGFVRSGFCCWQGGAPHPHASPPTLLWQNAARAQTGAVSPVRTGKIIRSRDALAGVSEAVGFVECFCPVVLRVRTPADHGFPCVALKDRLQIEPKPGPVKSPRRRSWQDLSVKSPRPREGPPDGTRPPAKPRGWTDLPGSGHDAGRQAVLPSLAVVPHVAVPEPAGAGGSGAQRQPVRGAAAEDHGHGDHSDRGGLRRVEPALHDLPGAVVLLQLLHAVPQQVHPVTAGGGAQHAG